jgi:hypothetical protein
MPWKPKVKIQLFKCKRCGKPFNNALTHVCVIRMDKPRRKRK